MDRRKKILILSTIFLISIFLMVTVIPPVSFVPATPASSNSHPTIGIKADPTGEDYPSWWDTSYRYRQEVIFNNTASPFPIVNRPVDIFITFPGDHCHHGTVRVQYWNSTSRTWFPGTSDGIPYQIWNVTDYDANHYSSFTITFYVNVSANSVASYFIYYDNDSGSAPNFTPEVSYTNPSGGVWNFSGQNYYAIVNSSTNGGKICLSYNNATGSWNSWAYDNEFHWSPQYYIDVIVKKGNKVKYDTWIYDSSGLGHSAESTSILEAGPLFIMFSTLTKLTLTSGGNGAPNEAGYANVTYRFFNWGWITETKINITYNFVFGVEYDLPGGWKRILELGHYVGNNYRFDPQLTTLTYKYGVTKTTFDPFISEEFLGEPSWFALYSTSNGQLAGVVDLMLPTINGVDSRSWDYITRGTSYTPEEWKRAWAVNLTIGHYINEKYAFYVGGNLSSFESFADGISFLGREGAPLIITIVDEEYIHYTVYVYVTDYDGAELANANVTVYSGSTYVDSKVTNSTGYARFYLEPREYSFNATWSGNTSYEFYTNSTISTITSNDIINLVFSEITTLWCQTKYTGDRPIQNAYINLTLNSTGALVDSSPVNLTGWAEFHIKRSSVIGNYSIKAFYYDGTQFETSYLNISIDSRSDSPLYFEEPIGSNIFTYIIFNTTTSFNVTWGTNVSLTLWWRDQSENNLSTTVVGGSLNWTLYYINGTLAYGPETLEPQVSSSNIHYIANIPSSLLYGGVTYQIYVNASAPSTNYLPAANQTVVFVQPATFSVTATSLSGTYYWKHSDIPLWVNVTNTESGVPVTNANVSFSITGTSVSGQLLHSSPPGNYTYTIPAGDVEAYLLAATYGLRITVSSTNYTTYTVDTQLMITPAQAELLISSIVEGYYGDVLPVSVLYRDRVDGTPIYTGTVSYFVWRQDVSGSLISSGSGNWTGSFDSTLLRPGIYVFRVAAQSPNYEILVDFIPLHIMEIPVEVKGENLLSSPVNEYLLVSVQLNDTHNNELVTGATVSYSVWTSAGTQIVSGFLTDASNGTYYTQLYLSSQTMPPGNYIIEVSSTKENYSSSSKVIQLVIQGIPTVLSPSTSYLSSLNNPAVFFLGNYGQTENGIVFPAIFLFKFVDSGGSPIPNATVSAGGWPLISLGNGNYAVIIPTYGLAPSAYPIVISASANLYESQQSFFLLQVKERTVLIPLINIRIPFTIFLVIVLAVAIPVCAMTGYSYVKRARIPAIIKRIDELILAINRGQKINVKPIQRDSVISKVLFIETSVVDVEPKVKTYMPVTLADRLVPLLVELGMTENEALTLIKELQKASPAQREKLLESLGVPSETSTTIIQTIEEEEEKKAKTKIEIKKTKETETTQEPQEETEKSPQEQKKKETQKNKPTETADH